MHHATTVHSVLLLFVVSLKLILMSCGRQFDRFLWQKKRQAKQKPGGHTRIRNAVEMRVRSELNRGQIVRKVRKGCWFAYELTTLRNETIV